MKNLSEYKRYKDDPFWMKSKYDGVSGEQRLPVQRRLRKGGVKFKKGDEILYYPKGKVIMVGKEAEQAWRDFQAAASDEDFYMSQYEESNKMKKTNEIKLTSPEYKKAIDFMSGLHTSILKAKDKVVAFLQRKGFDEMADELTSMSKGEFNRFVQRKVYEQKLRKQIRTLLAEIVDNK
tara:strand:+ start:1266 stop:1799 length:534 start_codon:yes stop_codon:yes gene_type:complete